MGLHAAAPQGGDEEMAEAVRVAAGEEVGGEIERDIAGKMGEAVGEFRTVEFADFLDDGFVDCARAHGSTCWDMGAGGCGQARRLMRHAHCSLSARWSTSFAAGRPFMFESS